jgi:hypothetical protein
VVYAAVHHLALVPKRLQRKGEIAAAMRASVRVQAMRGLRALWLTPLSIISPLLHTDRNSREAEVVQSTHQRLSICQCVFELMVVALVQSPMPLHTRSILSQEQPQTDGNSPPAVSPTWHLISFDSVQVQEVT